jgi:acyl-[acyl-carrier-protein]-phospholipid O-acyltransferase/long-chain-fatty-acid--[acyl-carrier-protein] ligase
MHAQVEPELIQQGVPAKLHLRILPELSTGPEAAVRLTSAWMEASAEAFAALPQLNCSLTKALINAMLDHPEARIIDGIDDSTESFMRILAVSIALAGRLKKITSDRRLGVILPPGKGATIANLACLIAGKVPVNFNYSNSVDAFNSAVRQSGVVRYITADTFMRKVHTFPWPPVRDLIFLDREIDEVKPAAKKWFLAAKFLPRPTFFRALNWKHLDEFSGDDEAILLFTSGSSSEPKGVALSHRNILGNIAQCASRIDLTPDSRLLSSLPVFHGFGITIGLFFPLLGGYDYVTYPSPVDTKRLGELIQQYNTQLVVTTPTFLRGYLKHCKPDTFQNVRYLIVGAEKLPPDLAKAFYDKFHVEPCEGYGMSEASPVCSVNFLDPVPEFPCERFVHGLKRGTVGACLPGLAVRITMPDDNKPLPLSYKGMIWLKGVNIFHGYIGRDELNREIFDDGWFRTGDIGSCDAQGFLRIEGRLSRFSKIAGEMVSHEAVELALMSAFHLDPASDERHLAVVSIPDEQRGEAIEMLQTWQVPSLQQELLSLRYELMNQRNPATWCPKVVVPVDKIPILPTGKLDLSRCRSIVYQAMGLPLD